MKTAEYAEDAEEQKLNLRKPRSHGDTEAFIVLDSSAYSASSAVLVSACSAVMTFENPDRIEE